VANDRNRLILTISLLILVACGPSVSRDPAADQEAQCQFLLEDQRAVWTTTLGLGESITVDYFGPCMCGVLYWRISDGIGNERPICLEGAFRAMSQGRDKHSFGFGGCHGKPGDITIAVGAAEEEAIIGVFSLWLIENFSLEELAAIEDQAATCEGHDYWDPATRAEVILKMIDSDHQRFRTALEVLNCGA
jgi:hypothetical protein